ncbi:glycoprotein endo-alpha-1,2-mannosidase-like protein [Babylonia areolata]|uniref:glycoprotein endo-alpha-1,2-mannosidase-like protein n=1 Tax=Babylonia areolata TaxID=304850 RepID=UPI003FD08BE4
MLKQKSVMARKFSSMPPSVRRYFVFLALVVATAAVSLLIYVLLEKRLLPEHVDHRRMKQPQDNFHFFQKFAADKNGDTNAMKIPETGLLGKLRQTVDQKIKSMENKTGITDIAKGPKRNNKITMEKISTVNNITLNYNVHLFYYPWYGSPETDGQYIHWNHQYIPHWRKEEAVKWPRGAHKPPEDIGSNFFPALGPYSSANPAVVDTHMKQIQSSGAGVVVVTWYPPDQGDDNGQPLDWLIPLLLDSAHRYGVKVAIHIEPYKGRSGETLKKNIKYIINTYGKHPGFYRREAGGKQLPVYYIYDSYQIDSSQWAEALKPGGEHSLRGTEYDGIFLGLYLAPEDEPKLLASGFDGFYTYFATNGFTKGSSWSNWKHMAKFAANNRLLFVPSVGPGYVDTRVRPWNAENTRKRLQGKYFRQSLQAAVDAGVKVVSVTSFNEWHEGTQLEPAVPKTIEGFRYEDYSPHAPDFYLRLLKEYVGQFS